MNKKSKELYWIYQPRFLYRMIIGTCITFAMIWFITMPFIIEPLYESETIVYVPLTLMSQQLKQHGIGYAGEQEIEWYMQLLGSNRLADSLINRFGLFRSGRSGLQSAIDTSRMHQRIASRIDIEKTRYGAVSVRIRDTNPEKASAMANEVIRLGEIIKERLLYPNRFASLQYAKNLYDQKADEVMALQLRLDSLQQSSQPERTMQGAIYKRLHATYELEVQEHILRKNRYEQEKNEFDTPLPAAYVVSKAVPSDREVRPKRLLLALAGSGIYLVILITLGIIVHDFNNPTQVA